MFCYSYSVITVSILSLINMLFFSSLEVFIIFELLRYGKKVAGLFQLAFLFNLMYRQALLSNELKHKQLNQILGKLSVPGFALFLRVIFRLFVFFAPFVQLVLFWSVFDCRGPYYWYLVTWLSQRLSLLFVSRFTFMWLLISLNCEQLWIEWLVDTMSSLNRFLLHFKLS